METAAPGWVLALAYWIHMAATIAWIGGLAAFSLFIFPISQSALKPEDKSQVITRGFRNLQRIGWMSIACLAATGMFQMSSSPFYKGFLQINNLWAVAILAKHGVILLMVLISAYGTWGLEPAMTRAVYEKILHPENEAENRFRLERRATLLMRANFGLGMLVLLLTAVARTA